MSPKNNKKKRKNKNQQQGMKNDTEPVMMNNAGQSSTVAETFVDKPKDGSSEIKNTAQHLMRAKPGFYKPIIGLGGVKAAVQNSTLNKAVIDKPTISSDGIKNPSKNLTTGNIAEKPKDNLDEIKTYTNRLDIVRKISNLLDVNNKRFISILEKLLLLHGDTSAEKKLRLQIVNLLLDHLETSDSAEVDDLLKICKNSLFDEAFQKYIVGSNALNSEGGVLGQGGFGIVTLGKLYKPDGSWIQVAVKTPTGFKDKETSLKEAKIMMQLDHENVVKILAFQRNPPKIAMEYMELGNLPGVLRTIPFTDGDLLKVLLDVASGMEYIANMNFVHRDLACRNIFVNSKRQCKVGDFGFCKYVGDTSGCYHGQLYILRMYHTAPEAKEYQIFSTKSDVWSMGILMWEMYYTVGSTVDLVDDMGFLATLHIFELTGRLPRPPRCPYPLSGLMVSMLREDPERRPSFTDIEKIISFFLA